MPFQHEPTVQQERVLVAKTTQRIVQAIKADDRVNVLHALISLQNVIGHLLATQVPDPAERQRLIATISMNVPMYVKVYEERERVL